MCSYYLNTLNLKSVILKSGAFVLLYDVLKWKKSRYISIGGLKSAASEKNQRN